MTQINCLLLLLIANCFTGAMFAADIKLVKKHVANSAIIIPDKAIVAEKFAAEELQYHIQKASGVKLPICKEKDTPVKTANLVYIGKCHATSKAGIDVAKLSPSGYVVKTIGKKLFLAGKDRVRSTWGLGFGNFWAADWQGTLFAVYDFLENDMGVRWLWPGELGEIIPHSSDITIRNIDRQGKPRFISSRLSVPKYPKDLLGWQSEKNKKNFLHNQKIFLLRHRFSAIQNIGYGHNFGNYWKRFGKTNPEFFNLLPNGKREPLKGNAGTCITMCVSQPALWKQIVTAWKRNPERNPAHFPHRPYVNACENDTPGMCTCAACRAWDAPDAGFKKSAYWGKGIIPVNANRFSLARAPWGEGVNAPKNEPPSLADRYAKFYLSLLKEAQKIDPDAKVFGYAYSNYWKAPKSVKLNKDIIISYVPPIWFPYSKKMSKEFRENWDGWHKAGAQMILRPNLTHAGANLPIFYARQIAGDISYIAQRGMIGSCFDSLLGAWSTQGPTLYALTRVHVHPEWSAEKILNEYYAGFGKAADAVKKYFEYWEKYSDSLDEKTVRKYCSEEQDRRGRPGGSFKNYVLIADRIFPPRVFANAHKLIELAKKSAKGDELAGKRVAFLEKGLIDAELTVAVRVAQKIAGKFPSNKNKKAFMEAFEKLKNYRASVEKDNICNFGYMAFRERAGAGWPWKTQREKRDVTYSPFVSKWYMSKIISKGKNITDVPYVWLNTPLSWHPFESEINGFVNVHNKLGNADGIIYLAQRFKVEKSGSWILHLGHDGGARVFVDGKSVLCVPERKNPAIADRSKVILRLDKGIHDIVIAFDLDKGMGWGIMFRFQTPLKADKVGSILKFPYIVDEKILNQINPSRKN